MKCHQVQEELLRSIDKTLSPRLRDHLLSCEECEREYSILQKTEQSLKNFGEAVRAGSISMEAPPVPSVRRRSFWLAIRDKLKTPVPVWVPSVIGVVGVLLFGAAIFSPLTPSVEWGARKGGENTGHITPPLSAEGMLEFLIVPEPTDAGQLTASIEAVETFLKMHPDDLAMHVKLVELYQARLKLGAFTDAERDGLVQKLSLAQERFLELLEDFTKGVHNDSE